MTREGKDNIRVRLRRIAGQVAGVQKMVDGDKYCVDILTQVAAIRSALDAVGVILLTDHIGTCVVGHGTASEHDCAREKTQEELLAEITTFLSRVLK